MIRSEPCYNATKIDEDIKKNTISRLQKRNECAAEMLAVACSVWRLTVPVLLCVLTIGGERDKIKEKMKWGVRMPFEIVRNDIANMRVDAIVNVASRMPQVNPGVDLAIHQKAGPALLEARRGIGPIEPGAAAVTPAFGLDAQYVIHAATPVWEDGQHGEIALLRRAYDRCLELAVQQQCNSIAFPLLATGHHGFPQGIALQVALGVFSKFLLEHEMQIYLVVFAKESLKISEQLFHKISCYIDENYVRAYEQETFRLDKLCRREAAKYCRMEAVEACMPCAKAEDLESFLRQKDAGFMETLLELIAKSGRKNSEIYKKANISKQHFSKLLHDPKAAVTKPTAVALALALELDLQQTKDLIGRAGYTFTNSSIFDLIIQFHIEQKIFNVIAINVVLYEFDQTLLGSV